MDNLRHVKMCKFMSVSTCKHDGLSEARNISICTALPSAIYRPFGVTVKRMADSSLTLLWHNGGDLPGPRRPLNFVVSAFLISLS